MIRKWSFAVCSELSFAAAGVSPYCVFARTVHQFCPNNTIFFPTGGAAAPPAPPPRTLMHASVLISVSCLGPSLSHVLLNMGVGYLNYIKKKMGSLIVPPRTVTKQTYIVTGKEYQV